VTRTFLHRCVSGAPGARSFVGAALALGFAAPAAVAAEPGGAEAPTPAPAPQPAPSAGVVSVSGTVNVTAHAATILGRVARFRGSTRPRDARRRVIVQRFDEQAARWVKVARAVVGKDGTFVAHWRTDRAGQIRLRALLRSRPARESRASGGASAAPQAQIASDELGVTVYDSAFATWYGPGFFGNRTACGQTLTEELQGVAHRTLPCGTKVSILYGGRTLIVPVVDRGPYAHGADWDLTQATARALGMDASDTIGAIALP
jgi:rare lipoprotein A